MWHAAIRLRRRGRGRGVTLIETLISSVLFSIVIGGVYMVYTTMQGTMARGEMKTDLQQNGRIGLARMVSEIRMAGNDPSNALGLVSNWPRAALRAASQGCLAFVASDNANQTVQITYTLGGTGGTTLQRREDNLNGTLFEASTFQPVAEAVQGLTFTYFDRYNKVLAPGAWVTKHTCPPLNNVSGLSAVSTNQLTFWQMRQVQRIAITLRTGDNRAGAGFDTFTLTTDVRLRNL